MKPHSCTQVPVHGGWQAGGEWFVEKQVIGSEAGAHLAIPNLLLSPETNHVPVSNLTAQPRLIKKGEVLAVVEEAKRALDAPHNEEQWTAMLAGAGRTASLVQLQMKLEDLRACETSKSGEAERTFVVSEDGEVRVVNSAETPN